MWNKTVPEKVEASNILEQIDEPLLYQWTHVFKSDLFYSYWTEYYWKFLIILGIDFIIIIIII